MDWIIKEFANLSLDDKRLNKRSQKVLTQLSRSPAESIPVGCGSAAETKAAYRFFDNEQVTAEKTHAVHLEATLLRMAEQPVVLLPQDTTVLNFSKQFARKDTGPTTKDAAKGMMLHCATVTPEKLCLGVVAAKQWHREKLQHLTKAERQKKDYSTPIENKESYRWLENYKLANEYPSALPNTLLVSIADREGDLYPIYKEANNIFTETGAKAHYLIRAKTDRKVCNNKGKLTGDKIKSALISDNLLGEIVVEVSETKTRKARKAHMSIYSKTIHVTVPDKIKKGENYQPVKVTAILCTEHNPPNRHEAIEWLLITDLPVATFEEACEKVRCYTCRWQIEIFFIILKSGCTVEKI